MKATFVTGFFYIGRDIGCGIPVVGAVTSQREGELRSGTGEGLRLGHEHTLRGETGFTGVDAFQDSFN